MLPIGTTVKIKNGLGDIPYKWNQHYWSFEKIVSNLYDRYALRIFPVVPLRRPLLLRKEGLRNIYRLFEDADVTGQVIESNKFLNLVLIEVDCAYAINKKSKQVWILGFTNDELEESIYSADAKVIEQWLLSK